MNKKQRMNERIENHGANLDALFPDAKKQGAALCKALRTLEAKASGITTDLCNGIADYEEAEKELETIEAKVLSLLGLSTEKAVERGFFINRDPRGYALKLDDNWTRGYRSKGGRIHTDWGGYGILAPDLTND